MYLKRFVDPDTPAGQEPFLWVFDMSNKEWKKRSPANVAAKIDFYIFENDEEIGNVVEYFLSIIESHAKQILDKIDTHKPISAEERGDLSYFIASLIIRTPFMRERLKVYMELDAIKQLSEFYKNSDLFEKRKEEMEAETGIKFAEDFTHDKLDPDKYNIRANPTFVKNLSLFFVINNSEEIARVIYNMTWTIILSESNYFITSDFPVNYYMNRAIIQTNTDLLSRFRQQDTQITLPISKSNCFVATWDEGMPLFIIAKDDKIRCKYSVNPVPSLLRQQWEGEPRRRDPRRWRPRGGTASG